MASTAQSNVQAAPFPVHSKQASVNVNGSRIEIMAMSFSDKIMVTIAQEGRLAHWVHVPLQSIDPNQTDRRVAPDEDGSHLLPMTSLTATTVLGLSGTDRDTLGHLFATQIATAIVARAPEESRLLVLGLGMKKPELERDEFLAILESALQCV